MAGFSSSDLLRSEYLTQSSSPRANLYPGNGFNTSDFLRQKYALDQAMLNMDGLASGRQESPFSMSGGTEGLYNNNWRRAGLLDALAIEAERGSEWWNQLQANVAGAIGGEQAKQDWTFDANKFDVTNGLDAGDLTQARNFVASLPGMLVGGVLEGMGDLYEGVSGRPINEFRKASNGGYEIPDYQLDASQRAGDLIDAGINLAGTLTGGAGRLIGGLGKAGAKAAIGRAGREFAEAQARGASAAELERIAGGGVKTLEKRVNDARKAQDLLEGLSKGVVTRAFEGQAGKELGTAAGIVSDMGDEAVEEFVQSYAEDIRNKTIDEGSMNRALTGAAWGAAGGGIMGGAGRALSAFSKIGQNQQDEDTGVTSDPNTTETRSDPYNALRLTTANSKMYMNSDGSEEMMSRNKDRRLGRAASVYKMTKTDPTLSTDQTDLGTWNIYEMFYNSQDDADALCDMLRTDYATLDGILNSQNAAEGLNNLVALLPRKTLQICVGRNPDTKNGGIYVDLRKFVDGQCFALHPIVANVLGADWDGDTVSVYMDPNHLSPVETEDGNTYTLTPNGYFTEMLLDPEGNSNIEWIWGGVGSKTRISKEEAQRLAEKYLKGLQGDPTIEDGNGNYVSLASGFASRLYAALNLDKGRDQALSKLFHDVNESLGKAGINTRRQITRDLLDDFLSDETTFIQNELEYWSNIFVENVLSFVGEEEMDATDKEKIVDEIKKQVNDWDLQGTTAGATKAFQMTKALGLLTYLADPNSKYNPIYRQYAGLKFSVNSVEALSDLSQALAPIFGAEKVVTSILRSAFRLAKPGIDPTTAIESMCDKMFMAELYSRTNVNTRKLNTQADIDNFKRVFIAIQSKYARIYNDAHEIITSKGIMIDEDSSYREPIDGKSHAERSDYYIDFNGEITGEMENMFWRQFHRCFGETDAHTFLSDDVCEALGILPGESLGNYFETRSRYTMAESAEQASMLLEAKNPETAKFIRAGIRTYGNEVMAIGQMAYRKIGEGFDFSNALRRWEAFGQQWDPMDVPMLLDYFNFLYRWIGPQNCLNIGLVLTDDLPNTLIGKKLFSSDPDDRINVVCGLSIYSQFIDSVTAFFSSDPQLSQIGENNLISLAEISPVHEMIVHEIIENDNTGILDWVTRLDVSMQDKISYFNTDATVLYKREAFIANCLQSETGKFAVSSVSAKNTRAEQARLRMEKNNFYGTYLNENEEFLKKCKEETANLKGTRDDLVGWFMDRGQHAAVRLRSDVLAMKAGAALDVDGSYVEKATIPALYSLLFSSAEIAENGGLASALSKLTGDYSGHIDRAQWLGNREHLLACAVDPNYACWVWDPRQQRHVLMSQETLFRSCGVEFHQRDPITAVHIEALFKTYPQVAGYWCNPTTNISYVGGDPQVSVARENRLIDDFNNWVTERKGSIGEENQYKAPMLRALRSIESKFADNANAQECIIAMAHKKNSELFEGVLDFRQISRVIEEATHEFAKFIMYYHANGGTDVNSVGRARVLSEIANSRLSETYEETMSAIEMFLDMVSLDTIGELKRGLGDEVATDIATSIILGHLETTSGISVGVDTRVGEAATAAVKRINDVMRTSLGLLDWICQGRYQQYQTDMMGFLSTYADGTKIRSAIKRKLIAAAAEEYKEAHPDATEEEAAIAMQARDAEFEATAAEQYSLALQRDVLPRIDYGEFSIRDQFLPVDPDLTNASDQTAFAREFSKLIEGVLGWDYTFQQAMAADPNYAIELVKGFYDTETVNGKDIKVLNHDRLNSYICTANSRIARHLLTNVASETNIPLNENMYQMSIDLDDRMIKAATDILNDLQTDNKFQDALTWDSVVLMDGFREMNWNWGKIPQFAYDSQTLQSLISNMRAADPAAGNAMKVGFNGLEQAKAFPTAHLPARIDDLDAAISTAVSKGDIESDYCRYVNLNVLVPRDNGRPAVMPVSSEEFTNILREANDSDSFQIFLPENNPHGLPTYNMPLAETLNAPGKEYHRLSGILSRICQYSMEAMVMKTKKLMKTTDHIATTHMQRSAMHNHLYTQDFEAINAKFHEFRKEYAQAMATSFREGGEMEQLGFGYDQALILSQALTPGMLLDVIFEDGTAGRIMADATLFFDSQTGLARDKFNAFIETVTGPDGQRVAEVRGAEVATLTVPSLGQRIMSKINSSPDGSNISVAEAERLAKEAMSDFSDYTDSYADDRAAVRTLMSQVPPVALAGDPAIKALGNEVAPQKFLSIISENVFGNSQIDKHSKTRGRILAPGTEDWKNATAAGTMLNLSFSEDLSEQLTGRSKCGLPVVKCWPGRKPKVGARKEDFYNGLLSIKETCDQISDEYTRCYGVFDSTDSQDFLEAVRWAEKTRGVLIVTEESRRSLKGLLKPGQFIDSKPMKIVQGSVVKTAYKLDLKSYMRLKAISRMTPKTYHKRKTLDSITMTCIVDSESAMPAKLHSLLSGDSVRQLFPRGRNRLVRDPWKTSQVPMTRIFPLSCDLQAKKSFVTADEAAALLDQIADNRNGNYIAKGNEAFESAGIRLGKHVTEGRKDPREIYQEIVDYLVDIDTKLYDRNRPYRPHPRTGAVACLVKSGSYIAPVLYPEIPYHVQGSIFDIGEDNILYMSVTGETPAYTEDAAGSWKEGSSGEAAKGTASAAVDLSLRPAVWIGERDGKSNTGIEIHESLPSESERSRVGGFETQLLSDVLYYMRALTDSSLFYEKNKDGSWSFKGAIANWSDHDKRILLSPSEARWDTLWDRVISGSLKISDDDSQNKIIQKVFSSLKNQGVNPLKFFSNYAIKGDLTSESSSPGLIQNARQIYHAGIPGQADQGYIQFNHRSILQNIEYLELLSLFNAVDNKLCVRGFDDTRAKDPSQRKEYIVGADGKVLVDWGNEYGSCEMYVRFGDSQILGDYMLENRPSGAASVSSQHYGARASDIGYTEDTLEQGIRDNNLVMENYDIALESYQRRNLRKISKESKLPRYNRPLGMRLGSMWMFASHSDKKEAVATQECWDRTWKPGARKILKSGAKPGDSDKFITTRADMRSSAFSAIVSKIENEMDEGSRRMWTADMYNQLAMAIVGASWSENMSEELMCDGQWVVTENQIMDALQIFFDSLILNDRHLPSIITAEDTSNIRNRYQMGLVPVHIARAIWKSFKVVRDTYGDFESFAAAMREEQSERADKNIESISINQKGGASRKTALRRMSKGLYANWGYPPNITLIGNTSIPEIDNDINSLAAQFSTAEHWTNEQLQTFKSLVSMSREKYEALRKHLDSLGYLKVETDYISGTETKAYNKVQEAKDIVNLMNNLAEASKVMAVINPFLVVGNLTDRYFHQGSARLNLWLGNSLRIGPYKSNRDHIVDSKIRQMSVNSDVAVALYQSYREMEFDSQEMSMILEMSGSNNIEGILDFVRKRKEQKLSKWYGKVHEYAFKGASGGSLGIKMQMETIVDRFVQFVEEHGGPEAEFWFAKTESYKENGQPMTRLEEMLNSPGGFAQFMAFCLGPNSPSYSSFMQAMNFAKAGDMAQKNSVGAVIGEICKHVPFGNFLMTTCISRFPTYGLNVTGRLLNYILPISSMYRSFNELMAKTDLGKGLGIEEMNIHTSMREAMIVDMCKMGVGGVAILLFGISGALQPPDDEKKWGNVDEWLVFGVRAGESWWLEDLLGMSLPLACFWKACEQGRPRTDILFNGIANACYSNPMLRCGDIAAWLMNPAESLVSDYNEEIVQFENAKGGAPSFGQYLQNNAFSLGMNWMSQFVTPSVLKEWWRSSQSLEKSYKRDWERSASGQITAAGLEGKTEYVTYDEAIKRKLAQRNPVLAFLFSIGNKSYMPNDMPDTVYYDEYQLDSSLNNSIAGLSDEDKYVKVQEIIARLESYNGDMDEAARDGIHLDYETLTAVANEIWDRYHAWDDWYDELQASGQLNFYTLGNGSFEEGQKIAAQLKQERDKNKQYYYNFYYQCLKNSPIAGKMQAYNRYNTSYAADVNGDIYATGIYKSDFNMLPFTTAPGTIEYPEGTAGYSNDFNTVSAVTGLPLSQRALIPAEQGKIELPDFEELSKDGSGKQYSQSYYDRTGKTPQNSGNTTTTTSPTSSIRSAGGGSGGSGGGGGYVKNAYVPTVSMPRISVSKIASRDRLQKSQYEYLRPDFETKGSREAYKRSDI